MKIWAISDLHLSLACESKDMGKKFSSWENYVERIKKNWNEKVKKEDVVLLPGDISWSSKLQDAKKDLEFIDKELNGKKYISPGNHDRWWGTNASLSSLGLESVFFIKRGVFRLQIENVSVCVGAIKFTDMSSILPKEKLEIYSEASFQKEISRAERVLDEMNNLDSKLKIFMMHYPPLKNFVQKTKISDLIESANVDICVFGHIHDKDAFLFNNICNKSKVVYRLVSADFLNFSPVVLYSSEENR